MIDEIDDVGRERGLVEVVRRGADPQQGGGELRRVVGGDGDEHVFEVFAQRFGEPPDHPEVEQAEHSARQREQVARVRIGVVEAVLEDHFEEQVGAVAGELAPIVLVPGRVFESREFLSVEPLERENPFVGELGEGLGDPHARVAFERLAELFDAAPLVSEVELAAERPLEFLHRR